MSASFLSSSNSLRTNSTSGSSQSQLRELHPLPKIGSGVPSPEYRMGDIVFVVGEGDTSCEPAEIVDMGYKNDPGYYIFDCVPLYNRALQGLFLSRAHELRKSRWNAGQEIKVLKNDQWYDVEVKRVKFWHGRFCYKVKHLCASVTDREKVMLLEEDDLLAMVEGEKGGKVGTDGHVKDRQREESPIELMNWK